MKTRLLLLLLPLLPVAAMTGWKGSLALAGRSVVLAFPNGGVFRLQLDIALLATLLAVFLAVLAILIPSVRRFLIASVNRLKRCLGPLALILSIFLSISIIHQPLGRAWLLQTFFLMVAVIAFLSPRPVRIRIARRLTATGRWFFGQSSRRIALQIAALATFITLCITFFLYNNSPVTGDAGSSLFQAVLLAHGRFCLVVPGFADFYNGTALLLKNDSVCSMYPPGHPLMLAVGELFHAAWLVGPALGGATAALVFRIGEGWFGRPAGLLAAALLMSCPHFIAMTPSYLSHSTTLFFLTLFLYLIAVTAESSPSTGSAMAIGFAAGMAFISRPLTALALGLPVGIVFVLRHIRRDWRLLLPAVAGMGVVALFFLYYNFQTTGDPLVSGYQAFGPQHRMGFGGVTEHTPEKGFYNTLSNLWEFSRWGPGGFPSAYLWLALWIIFGPHTWKEVTLAAMWCGLPFAYFFYYHQDYSLGPRLIYEAILPAALLSAQSVATLCQRLSLWAGRADGYYFRRLITYAGMAMIISSLPVSLDKIPTIGGLTYSPYYMEWRRNFTHDPQVVVFVDDSTMSVALAENLRHPHGPLFLQHQGHDRNQEYMESHPDKIYYFNYRPYEEVLRKFLASGQTVFK